MPASPLYAGHVAGRYLVFLVHRSLDQEEPHLGSCTPGDSAIPRPAADYEIMDFELGVVIKYYLSVLRRVEIFHMWEGCASLRIDCG